MIKRLTTNFGLGLIAAGQVIFWLMYLLFGHDATVEIASGMVLGGDIMLAFTWAAAAGYALRYGAREGEGLLALGLFATASFSAMQRLWVMFYRWEGRPDWMLDHWSNPLAVWSVFWGLLIILLAPGTERGNVPQSNQWQLLIAVAIGMLVAGITIGLSLAKA